MLGLKLIHVSKRDPWCLLTAALLTRCVLWCTRHWPDDVVMTTWGGGRTGGTRPQHGIHTATWILPVDIHLQVCGQKPRERISDCFVHLIIQRQKSWILIQSRSVQHALSYNLKQHRMAYILLRIPTFVNKSTFGHVTRQEYPRMHVWCKFGDSSSNQWWVIVQTKYSLRTDIQMNRQTDRPRQGQYPFGLRGHRVKSLQGQQKKQDKINALVQRDGIPRLMHCWHYISFTMTHLWDATTVLCFFLNQLLLSCNHMGQVIEVQVSSYVVLLSTHSKIG